MRRSFWRTLLLGVALCTVASTAQATTIIDQSLTQLTNHAERVVLGRVVSTRTRLEQTTTPDGRVGRSVYTDVVLAVDEVLKGDPARTEFTLSQLGGSFGEGKDQLNQRVIGYPEFAAGERVVLFLEHLDTGRLAVSALALGKYTVTTDPATGELMAARDGSDLLRRGQPRPAQRVLAGMPASDDRLPLAQLRQLVAGQRLTPTPLRVLRVPASASPGVVVPVTEGPLGGAR